MASDRMTDPPSWVIIPSNQRTPFQSYRGIFWPDFATNPWLGIGLGTEFCQLANSVRRPRHHRTVPSAVDFQGRTYRRPASVQARHPAVNSILLFHCDHSLLSPPLVAFQCWCYHITPTAFVKPCTPSLLRSPPQSRHSINPPKS